jgi:2-methylcitrate dehydratase PrpD
MDDRERYRVALLDWLACAAGGWEESAARAARAGADRSAALGTAGHVLDFDDTWLPGIAHLSAPTAPAALALAAELDRTVGEALDAYAAGFEAMAALAQAGYPALYDGGWHPTAVCGTVGAAVAAATLLGADPDAAAALAALRAAGLRAAFGGDGKSLQVGLSASAGARAARVVAAARTSTWRGCKAVGSRPTARPGRASSRSRRSAPTGSRPTPAACRRTARSSAQTPPAAPRSTAPHWSFAPTRSRGRPRATTTW